MDKNGEAMDLRLWPKICPVPPTPRDSSSVYTKATAGDWTPAVCVRVRGVNRHVSKLAAAAIFAFPRNGRFFVPRVATFKTVYVLNIAKTIFREMLTVFLYIVLIRKSRLIIHMQIWMMRNDYQADKKEPKLRSTKSSSYLF